MPAGKWRDRFVYALETSLRSLGPHRVTLRALVPVMVGDVDEGVFAQSTAFSRRRVQAVFRAAVVDARRTAAETGRSPRPSPVLDASRSHPLVAAGQESGTTCHEGTFVVVEADASVGDAGPAADDGARGRSIRRYPLWRSTPGRA